MPSGNRLLKPVSRNRSAQRPRIVGRPGRLDSDNVDMVVVAMTGFCSEELVKVLVSGSNPPLLPQEALIVTVAQPIDTAIHTALKPRSTNAIEVFFQVSHWMLTPSRAWKGPLPADLNVRVEDQGILDEGVGIPKHLPFSSAIHFKLGLLLRSAEFHVRPLAPLCTGQGEPQPFGFSNSL